MNDASAVDLRAFGDSRYAQQLRTASWWLRLPSDLERQFREFHLRRIRSRVRVFFTLWPLMEIVRTIGALIEGDEGMLSLWLLPNAVFIAAAAWILWSRWYWRLYLPAATLLALVFVTYASYSLPHDHPGNSEMQALKFVLNVPLVTYLLLGLTFGRAAMINVLCAISFSIAAFQVETAPNTLFSCIFVVTTATIVAAVLAYTTERAARRHFLQERLIAEIATRDGLTGLQNRAAFDAHVERLWKQGQRTQEPIGLLLLDVDHFKRFNDVLGHQAGDECLRRVAATLKAFARRPLDLAARYGGEEFALIFFQSPPEQMRAVAEAVRANIEALGLSNPAAPNKIVTISCGLAVITPAAGRSVHGLVQLADEALYEAKESGRNCVRSVDQNYADLSTGRFRQRSHLRVVS